MNTREFAKQLVDSIEKFIDAKIEAKVGIGYVAVDESREQLTTLLFNEMRQEDLVDTSIRPSDQ